MKSFISWLFVILLIGATIFLGIGTMNLQRNLNESCQQVQELEAKIQQMETARAEEEASLEDKRQEEAKLFLKMGEIIQEVKTSLDEITQTKEKVHGIEKNLHEMKKSREKG